ncbi:hypothetical protein TTHERM_00378900 (macronuclear) [Tetrahymena thermophila SB210]|uniref:Uncharacterized protein n=1 Tax=Tetrahymena thermophila (strain SB210) TaxID=312017 RepID=Q23FC7_TETTS|nr:hypothetical protein TTHERM_00378900 [Tetrahymena thermophila SB210]EAR95226.2 hypothetical protein TTHERM_00378900 [Tetrahymena thermophila SB210]|eukprot:XP_001015471.2 hypothetical protein TTHERM_00378900 [Tetrahymena thermophila SB210]
MKQMSLLENQNIISFNQQNLNEKKKLQQFLIENDISFILNKQGVYEATIKLTQDDNKNENNKSQSPQKLVQKDNKNNQAQQNNNSSNEKNNKQGIKQQPSNKKQENNVQENGNQNKFQQYLNEKINVFQYLNDQKRKSISPSQQKLTKNLSENVINGQNNNITSGIKQNNSEKAGAISRQNQSSQQSQYSKSRPGSKLNYNQKVEEAAPIISQQQQLQQQQQNQASNSGKKQSKQQSQNRNYVNTESSPYRTDFQTRWRLNRSRTPESPNTREMIDISMIELIKNRPQTSNSKKKKQQKEIFKSQQDQDQFNKTAFMGLENEKQTIQPQQKQSSPNINSQFNKSTKLNFDTTLILKKNGQNLQEQATPEKKIIALQKVDNKGIQNQFTINLVEDASAFKNRSNSSNNLDRKKTVNQNFEASNIFQKNKNQEIFGKSTILGENKLQNKKQSSDKFNQSQALWLNNMKTASFNKNEQPKGEKQLTDENLIYNTPSAKKKKENTRKSQFEKFPSSAEIIKKIQNNYMNPVQYPVVQDQYNYTAIQANPKSQKTYQSPPKNESQPRKSVILSNFTDQNQSKLQATPTKTKNDKIAPEKKNKTEFTPEKTGAFTIEDFSPAKNQTEQNKSKVQVTPSKIITAKGSADKSKSKHKNEFTPDKPGFFTKDDFFPNSEQSKQKNFQNNTINSFKNSTLQSSFQSKTIQKGVQMAPKGAGMTQSEISMNERSLSSNKKEGQQLKNTKDRQNKKNQSSRSNTPDKSVSLSDASINDRLSFFRNSRLSNMPDIKLKVKQNHNYSAVLLPNESLNGSRPASKVGMRGTNDNILNSLNNQEHLDQNVTQNHLMNSQPRKSMIQQHEELNGVYNQQSINFMKQNMQNYNSKNDKEDPKHYQINLNDAEEEIHQNNKQIDQIERLKQNNHSPEMRKQNKSGQRGSILLLNNKNDRDQFEQDYFSFNSNNVNNQFSSQKMLSSQFMNVDKNDPYLQIFRDEDLRMSQGAQDQLESTHKYTKIEKSSPSKNINNNSQMVLAADDVNVEQLSSNELVHYYKFILEKAKQNQFQVIKSSNNQNHKTSQQKK